MSERAREPERGHQGRAATRTGPREDDGRSGEPRSIEDAFALLQQTAGNQAVGQLLAQRRPEDGAGEAAATAAGAAVAEQVPHSHGEPEPGDETEEERLDRERPVGGTVPDEIRSTILQALSGSARAERTLAAIEEERGDRTIPFKWSRRGNYHRTGEIHLARTGNEASWVRSTAHEIVHLHTYLSGGAADLQSMGRDEFVEAKMTDEINASAHAYVTLLQLGGTTSPPAGYSEFIAGLREDHQEWLDDGDWAPIEAHARAWLEDKYRNEWTTSNTGENYYEYWGRTWDAAHPDD